MRFTDDNIKLKINGLSFKAYLEDSDVNHVTKDQQLPFSPVSFVNDSMATRLNETVKFSFNVFSETREECVENYKNLLRLIQSIKPIYYVLNDQYVPSNSNVTGLVTLSFSGMPSRNTVKLHLNNFNYSLNKDIGYIELTNEEIRNPKSENLSFFSKSMKLVPLAYKINLEGKVLLPFRETIIQIGERQKASGVEYSRMLIEGAGSTDPDYIKRITQLYKSISGQDLSTVNPKDMPKVLAAVKKLKDDGLAEENGTRRYPEEIESIPLLDSSLLAPIDPAAMDRVKEARRQTIDKQYRDLVDIIKPKGQ